MASVDCGGEPIVAILARSVNFVKFGTFECLKTRTSLYDKPVRSKHLA